MSDVHHPYRDTKESPDLELREIAGPRGDVAQPAFDDGIARSFAPLPLAPRPGVGLTVGAANDPAEAAADRMAGTALARLGSGRAGSDPTGERPPAAQLTGIGRLTDPASSSTPGGAGGTIGAAGGETDSATSALIAGSSGRPLSGPARQRMETAFGRSFGHVRIHDGDHAAQASATLQARAFTHGSDIFFARGQFDPESSAGEHVLAHELAHVVQGGSHGAAHRLFGFGKSDPAKELEKQKAKEEKERRKKEERERKAKEKQERAEAKERAKVSKQNQKAEKKRLGQERKIGKAKRTEMRDAIAQDQQDGSVTSGKANDLNQRFAAALAAEKNLFDTLVEAKGEEAARDIAYRTIWMDTDDQELRAVRPPRETAAERLVRGVKQMRTDGNVRQSVIDDNQRGTMLSKSVELVYETFVVEVDRLMGPPDNLSLAEAEAEATKTVWDLKSNAAAKKKRPAPGSALDEHAKKEARQRQNLNPTPPKKAKGLDKAIETTDDVAGYVGYGTKATGLTSMALNQAGKKETKELQKGLTSPTGASGGVEEKIPGGVGSFAKSINQAKYRVEHGQKDDAPEKVLPKSVETQAGEGIGITTNILTDLLSGVQGLFRFAKSVQTAHTDRTPSNIMKATKASADALSVVAKTGKDAAELAKFIDPGVTTAVGSVIPGFNIFISVMSIISNAMTMGTQAIHVHQTDEALFAARGKEVAGDAPAVMVYPLLRALQTYTKSLEQAVWSTAIAIANLATSIATVASGGGYGIPVAVQAGVKVVDLLHSVGHFIAGEVLTAITTNAQKDQLLSLEGAAENSLQKDPTMAVDGIIFTAVKGDVAAEMFLKNYRLGGKPIDRTMLDQLKPDPANVGNEHLFFQIRSAVMAEMGEDEDPQYFYQKWFKKAGALFATVKDRTYDRWNQTGELAGQRNEMDGSAPGKGKRGAGWRIKMMFKGKSKFGRSMKKTGVEREARGLVPAPVGPTVEDNSTMGYDSLGEFTKNVEVTCGTAHLAVGATEQQREVFAAIVDKMPDNVLLAASNDPNNSDEWREFFRAVLSDRAMELAGAGA
jgi:hypothetical protein